MLFGFSRSKIFKLSCNSSCSRLSSYPILLPDFNFIFIDAFVCTCKASDDSNGEVEPIDMWEEEDEAEPEVWFDVCWVLPLST